MTAETTRRRPLAPRPVSTAGPGRPRHPVTRRLRTLLVLLAFLPLTGCQGQDGASGGPPRVGDPVPQFRAPSLDGDTVALADLEGSPYLLNLWATWCPPCRHETPFLQSVWEENRDRGLRVVGVTVDTRSALDQARAFLDEAGADYLQLHDPSMSVMDLFAVPGLPATFLVDADGVIRFARTGPVMEGDAGFEAAVDSLLSGP